MDDTTKTQLLEACKEVLAKNERSGYTVPAGNLYPHQWLWDSCFTAIGLASYDIPRAKKELTSLLRGQWANGMLPNMIFAGGLEYRQDRELWRSHLSPFAPDDVATSGITQPPMLAEAVLHIGKKLRSDERRTWYQTMYPALLAYHEWIYAERDPHDDGLALLIHPWESGLDNSPTWINQLLMHHRPWWVGLVQTLRLDSVMNFIRRDTRMVPPGQRISNIEALLYYDVIRRLRRKAYNTEAILPRSEFLVEDLAFNCMLIRANECLTEIAKAIRRNIPDVLEQRMAKTPEILEQLWDGYSSQYYSRNFVTHKLIKEQTIATLLPLYAGTVTKERAEQLVKLLESRQFFGADYPVPSVPLHSPWFRDLKYWQGPTWINTNWMIIQGLKRYGFDKHAENLRQVSLGLVLNGGPFEYFSPLTGKPGGAHDFSWTAALTIDLLN